MVAMDADDVRVRPIEDRLAEAMRLPSPVVWILATLLVLVLCTAWHNATGVWNGLEVDGEPFWHTPWHLEIVFAVILGYVMACGGWIVRSVRCDLDALAPALAIEPSELAAERAGIGLFSRSALLAACAGGVAAGVVVHSLVNAILPPGSPALEDRLWRLVRVAVSMIAAMADDELISVILLSVAIVGAVRAFTVLLPVRGAHRAIRAAKNAELLAVRGAIARAHAAAIVGGMEGAEGAMRLSGLLAFEERIAGVGEWPFDVGTFVRFTLFLALPLGSWIVGALVEWMVSRVLG
jgi:hypothetical protein